MESESARGDPVLVSLPILPLRLPAVLLGRTTDGPRPVRVAGQGGRRDMAGVGAGRERPAARQGGGARCGLAAAVAVQPGRDRRAARWDADMWSGCGRCGRCVCPLQKVCVCRVARKKKNGF